MFLSYAWLMIREKWECGHNPCWIWRLSFNRWSIFFDIIMVFTTIIIQTCLTLCVQLCKQASNCKHIFVECKMMGVEYDPTIANLLEALFVLGLSTPSHDMCHWNMTNLSFLDCLFFFCIFFFAWWCYTTLFFLDDPRMLKHINAYLVANNF
jgi:hypothetical protein